MKTPRERWNELVQSRPDGGRSLEDAYKYALEDIALLNQFLEEGLEYIFNEDRPIRHHLKTRQDLVNMLRQRLEDPKTSPPKAS